MTEKAEEVEQLEDFKARIIRESIDPQLDRLLDLRNLIRKADSFETIATSLKDEKKYLTKTYPELDKEDEDKKADMS